MDQDIRETKQVIVIRRDLKMRRGKEIAQGSHASEAWWRRRIQLNFGWVDDFKISEAEEAWLAGNHTKIVCQVKDFNELMDLDQVAKALELESHFITDAGLTELPPGTVTALAIGPDWSEKIDVITRDLKLY